MPGYERCHKLPVGWGELGSIAGWLAGSTVGSVVEAIDGRLVCDIVHTTFTHFYNHIQRTADQTQINVTNGEIVGVIPS